mmetsp:Transcript_41923/g.64167  ORF Transcript_41923/g.64167 Transcript_41923/m.64167 type:complete len:311 (-) Transcript_41923:207-1139(-)
MVPRRPKGILSNQPSRREDHEIADGLPRLISLAGQHSENRRVGMIVTNGADCVVQVQVILVRAVVSVPGNDIEGRVVLLILEELASILALDIPCVVSILVPGSRRLEVHGVGESISSNGSEIRQNEVLLESLANVSSCLNLCALIGVKLIASGIQVNLELDSSLNNADLEGLNSHPSEFGGDEQRSFLRHNEVVTIRVVESSFSHVLIKGVDVHTDTVLHGGVACSAHRSDALNEVVAVAALRVLNGQPSFLGRVNMQAAVLGGEVRDVESLVHAFVVGRLLELPLAARGQDSVHPTELVLSTTKGERSA